MLSILFVEKERLEKIRDRTRDKKERKEKESVEVNKKLAALQKEEKESLKKLFTEAKVCLNSNEFVFKY